MILNKLGEWMDAQSLSANQLHADTGITLNTIRTIRRDATAPIAPATLAILTEKYRIPVSELIEAGEWQKIKGKKVLQWIRFE